MACGELHRCNTYSTVYSSIQYIANSIRMCILIHYDYWRGMHEVFYVCSLQAKSSCSTSLETLLYRQTSKPASKFIRVPGKMGWFGLRRKTGEELERERNQPPPTARGSRTSTTSVTAAAATQVSGASRPVVEKEAVEGDRGVGCDGGRG